MNAKKVNVPMYEVTFTEEEREIFINNIKSLNDGEGSLDDFPLLTKIISVLNDLKDIQ